MGASEAMKDRALDALLHHVGFAPVADVGWICVLGADRVRWLNGMVTNSIQGLTPGTGCYNFVLNAQGRIQGDAYAFMERQHILLHTGSAQVITLTGLLERYIIMDEVEVAPPVPDWSGVHVIGPEADSVFAKIGLSAVLKTPGIVTTGWQSGDVTVVRLHSPLVPRFELWAEDAVIAKLSASLLAAGSTSVSSASLEQLRLLEGTPRFGVDIRERELPQETGQADALHFAKGCYLGQEIVERIRSRGNVHRTLSAFRLEGDEPLAGMALSAEGKISGELTSSAWIPSLSDSDGGLRLALGYVRRETLENDSELTYDGGRAIPIRRPYSLVT